MSKNRDKTEGKSETRRLLQSARRPKYNGGENWLGHGTNGGRHALIDYMLLDGATKEEIIGATGWKWSAVNSHFRSLREDHDLHKVRTADGRYMFDRHRLGIIDIVDRLSPDDAQEEVDDSSKYVPNDEDSRAQVIRQIRERRGQRRFRDSLRDRYGDKCLVSGCEILDLIEAAHIKPYRGENDNNVENGLLIRADLHTLFDLNLLGIEPRELRVELSPAIVEDSTYNQLAGRQLRCGSNNRPSVAALKQRYEQFKERWKGN